MVEYKVVISDPDNGRAHTMTVSGGAAGALVGKKIGDEVDAGTMGLAGYKLRITGASDRNGTPARKDLPGIGRKRLLLAGGVGYHPTQDGMRRRKSVRGNEITTEFVQVNTKISFRGEKPLEEYFKKEEKKEEKK